MVEAFLHLLGNLTQRKSDVTSRPALFPELEDQAPNRRANSKVELQPPIIGQARTHQICRKIFHIAMNNSIKP